MLTHQLLFGGVWGSFLAWWWWLNLTSKPVEQGSISASLLLLRYLQKYNSWKQDLPQCPGPFKARKCHIIYRLTTCQGTPSPLPAAMIQHVQTVRRSMISPFWGKISLPRSCIPASGAAGCVQRCPHNFCPLQEAVNLAAIATRMQHICASAPWTVGPLCHPVVLALSPQSMAHQGWEWVESSAKAAHQSVALYQALWSLLMLPGVMTQNWWGWPVSLPLVPDRSQKIWDFGLPRDGKCQRGGRELKYVVGLTWYLRAQWWNSTFPTHEGQTLGGWGPHQSTELTQTTHSSQHNPLCPRGSGIYLT